MSLGAALRVMRRTSEAESREAQALELARSIAGEQTRTYAVAPLAMELAGYGIVRQELLSPQWIAFAMQDQRWRFLTSAPVSGSSRADSSHQIATERRRVQPTLRCSSSGKM